MKNSLPSWDLSDLYLGVEDEKIKDDLEKYKKLSLTLEKDYKNKLSNIDASSFYLAIKTYEEMTIISRVLSGFAYLNMATKMNDAKATAFYQYISETITEYSKPSIFFTLELNNISEDKMSEFLSNDKIKSYSPWIERIRKFKKYELSEDLESLLVEKDITSASAWVRFYDERSVEQQFTVDGKEYNDSEIYQLVQSKDIETRHKAGKEINKVCRENANVLSFIYNMIIKDKSIEDNKRGFKRPVSSMCLSNNVEEEVVDALAVSVKENYSNIAHRFYKLKSKWLGVNKLSYWDRNAPLNFEDDKEYSWDEAVNIVLDAYKQFSPKLYELALNFFEKPWVDVPTRNGKRSGAFAHPVSASKHPYLFLNFTGKRRDILTLAHELGHGCHMLLSHKQGELQDDTPLTLAEVASVFGESLTFKKLLDETEYPKTKLCLIASKVNDMINTAIRQISFHLFEQRCHDERKKGELSSEAISKIWQEELALSLGDYVSMENAEHVWSQVSHFFHVPFYVYAYSFADCVVNSLFKVYLDKSEDKFEDKYLDLLSRTGVEKYDSLLQPFGLDAKSKDFWNKGLSVISNYIDELEKLDKETK